MNQTRFDSMISKFQNPLLLTCRFSIKTLKSEKNNKVQKFPKYISFYHTPSQDPDGPIKAGNDNKKEKNGINNEGDTGSQIGA